MLDVTLSTPKVVVPAQTAAKLRYRGSNIREDGKYIHVKYQWLDADGEVIRINGVDVLDHYIRDTFDPDTGDPILTDFSDILGFVIRQQDVGATIGPGLRTLIVNKLKTDLGVS